MKPTFTKKHYEFIARCVRESKASIHGRIELAKELEIEFKKDNPNFNPTKFWAAINKI